jgi:putative FmdB family regulatory protein
MPIYRYACEKCHTEREELRPLNASPPTCCGQPMMKEFTAPGHIRVKGGTLRSVQWYKGKGSKRVY